MMLYIYYLTVSCYKLDYLKFKLRHCKFYCPFTCIFFAPITCCHSGQKIIHMSLSIVTKKHDVKKVIPHLLQKNYS